VTLCSVGVGFQHFGGPCCLHLQSKGKVKVKSLCFNWAQRHEGILGGGGIALHILDLVTRWRWVVSFTPGPLYPQVKRPWYPLVRRGWVGTRAGLDAVVKRNIPSPCRESNPDLRAHGPALYRWTIPAPRFLCKRNKIVQSVCTGHKCGYRYGKLNLMIDVF
jgi:hypothetical protein